MLSLVTPTPRSKFRFERGQHLHRNNFLSRSNRASVRVCASDQEDAANQFSLAPSKPSTPFGQMAAYYLEMEPALFRSAIEDQFQRLRDEQEKREAAVDEAQTSSAEDSMDLTISGLNTRVQQMRDSERRATVEDLMYMCVLESFLELGISMLPRTDNYTDVAAVSLQPLMEGVHTKEALDLVKEHMMSYMGPTAMLPTTTVIKMSKLQMLKVYASSVIFGYFLRRSDQRFRLARAAGLLPEDQVDTVQRLERLFALDSTSDGPDLVAEGDGSNDTSNEAAANEDKKPLLKKYISSFDRATLVEMHRIMSIEGRGLIDRQITALWGDAQELQEEMQGAIGVDASSVEELMQRADEAVIEDKVQTVTLTLATQRRAVLEAIAFGTFVRDTEVYVDTDFGLLTTSNDEGPGLLPSA